MSFTQIDRLDTAQLDDLLVLFRELWWARGRGREDAELMLANSLIVAFVDPDRRLAAFARVVTDRVYKAWILDVVVDPRHRGTGLGQRLIDAVVGHPTLADVRHLELYCAPDLVPFYQRWGFTAELGTLTPMRLDRAGTGAIPPASG